MTGSWPSSRPSVLGPYGAGALSRAIACRAGQKGSQKKTKDAQDSIQSTTGPCRCLPRPRLLQWPSQPQETQGLEGGDAKEAGLRVSLRLRVCQTDRAVIHQGDNVAASRTRHRFLPRCATLVSLSALAWPPAFYLNSAWPKCRRRPGCCCTTRNTSRVRNGRVTQTTVDSQAVYLRVRVTSTRTARGYACAVLRAPVLVPLPRAVPAGMAASEAQSSEACAWLDWPPGLVLIRDATRAPDSSRRPRSLPRPPQPQPRGPLAWLPQAHTRMRERAKATPGPSIRVILAAVQVTVKGSGPPPPSPLPM